MKLFCQRSIIISIENKIVNGKRIWITCSAIITLNFAYAV